MEPSSTSNQHPPFQDLVTITGFNTEEGLIGFAFAEFHESHDRTDQPGIMESGSANDRRCSAKACAAAFSQNEESSKGGSRSYGFACPKDTPESEVRFAFKDCQKQCSYSGNEVMALIF